MVGVKKPTQTKRIIQYMREMGGITSLDAFREIGCTRLSARIADLERLGWSFNRTSQASKNRWGDKVTFTRYSIDKAGLEL